MDEHPRVRWAAINAMGQLETDLGPDLQNGSAPAPRNKGTSLTPP